jgi:hypothetical protein
MKIFFPAEQKNGPNRVVFWGKFRFLGEKSGINAGVFGEIGEKAGNSRT